MSKLERLNARVAKLLSVAVHEVLEVVKETVSEYQEKTARTQRENESLKRRLQELQDVFRRDNTSTAPTAVPEDQEDADQQQQQLDFSLCLKEDAEPSLTEHKPASSLELSYELRHEPRDLERAAEGDTLAECVLAQAAAEHCKVQPEEATPVTEEAPTVHTPHGAKRDARAETPGIASAASRPLPASLGFSLAAVIKTEPEVTDCTAAEPSAVQEAYGGCVDLSYNSSRQDAAEAQKTQVGNAPYGLVFVHSNHSSVSRRYGLVKANRAAFESRRTRRDHFRRDDPHVCFVCGKTFSRVGNLRIHQRCHTGEKPYGCLQCGRCFSQAGDLKKHKRVHTGEKPYYCSQCGKSFSRGENLKRHQKIHIGETLQMQQVWKEHQ